MTSTSSTPARNEFFQQASLPTLHFCPETDQTQLKKYCVPISGHALRGDDGPEAIRELTELTEQLNLVIRRQLDNDPSVLNDKLADYVFFPLSHVLRHQVKHPARLIEACIRCTTMLISHGWKATVPPEMVEQLLILLTFIVGGVPGREETHDPPEEVVVEALGCLAALITNASASAAAAASLVDAKNIPSLGHAVTVVLESIVDGKTPEIKTQAISVLQAMFLGIKDHAALATFLPGVVSNLARLLATPAREKTRVLVGAIESLQKVLIAVLSDLRTRSILARPPADDEAQTEGKAGDKVLSAPWLRATTMQIRLALVSVLKLRTYQSEQVRDAVGNLALALLDECHNTLENCASLLVETSIMLASEEVTSFPALTSLSELATIYPELGETIKATVYAWITGLPRVMQSADEEKKQRALQNVLRGTRLVSQLHLDSSTLDDAVSLALRESVSSLIQSDRQKPAVHSISGRPAGAW